MSLAGQTFLHYRVQEKIGEGGMGSVYKAQDTHLDRPVAVKFLPAERMADPDRKQRFVQEAKAASSLNHPNIIVIHDIASDGGQDFIVMEYVDGKTLDQLIGRKGMKLNEALGLAVQIADGLAGAHAAGIVHRDLKPTNVMVTPEGRVKILDFGLAKLTEEVEVDTAGPTVTLGRPEKPQTEEGFIMGTVAYMSPEQAEGKKVDSRSDVFSFGALLYEMLTGSKAFRGETRMSTLAAILREDPKPVAQLNETLPPDLEQILARCLRKDPQRRWQNMSDLKVVLQDLREDSESGKLRAPQAAAKARGKSLLVWAIPAAIVVAAAVFLWILLPRKTGPPEYEITRLTFDSGVTWAPVFSPDGKMFAYASDRGGAGNSDIWVQQVAGGTPLRLTTDPGRDDNPSFSSDGSRVIYHSSREGDGIFEVGTLGGGERLLGGPGFLPRCSPDGAWISYIEVPASLDPNLVKMFLMPSGGGTPIPFQPEFNVVGLAASSAPVWSPDGKYIIFNGRRADDPASVDWWVAPVGGGPAVRTGAHSSLRLTSPSFRSPYAWAGAYIYYATGTTVEGVNLFRAPIEKGAWKVNGPAERITSGAGMQGLASVLADGRVLYANLNWVMNISTLAARPDQGVVSGSPVSVSKDVTAKFSPSLSRDGLKLAYAAFSGFRDQGGEVRLTDLASGELKVYPIRGAQLSLAPRISPDGTVLSYRERAEGKSRAFVVSGQSASPRQVCDSCVILGFYSDPSLALVQEKEGRQLLRYGIATGDKAIILESSSGRIVEPALSPDDRWLAFILDKPDGRVAMSIAPIAATPPPEKDWITLFDEKSYLGSPAWSPDGTYLYYLSQREGPCSVWVQKLDPKSKKPDGASRVVFRPPGQLNLNLPQGNGTVAVGRDKLALYTSEGTGNIYLATPKKK